MPAETPETAGDAPPPHPVSPQVLREGAIQVVRRLLAHGFTAYWAGGCVRDQLLAREPKDYDVATSARPEQVEPLFPGSITVGKSFGVVRVPIGDCWYEVATFRSDHGYTDGRHPTGVTFSDPPNDAARRDFTINALFYDVESGDVLDFVGGQADIRGRVVRCVGDPERRFFEDHLRLLRAVRFATTLDFTIDPATADAIRRLAPHIATISSERVRDELTRILLESRAPGDAVVTLSDLGLLEAILPEVAAMRGVAQPPEFHPEGDVFRHTVIMLNRMTWRSAELAYAILLHDVGKPATAQNAPDRIRFPQHASVGAVTTESVLRRLKFATSDIGAIAAVVRDHMRMIDVQKMRPSTLRRIMGSPTFPLDLELHRLDCLSSHGGLENYEFLRAAEKDLAGKPALPPPWVSGHDVLALGVAPGPQVGVWLRRAYEAQLDSRCASPDELRGWLREEIARES